LLASWRRPSLITEDFPYLTHPGYFLRQNRECRSKEAALLARAFISVIASIRHLPAHFTRQPKPEMADTLIDVFLYGLMPMGR
jgi:hypothetical protein